MGDKSAEREERSAEILAVLDRVELLVKQLVIAANQAVLHTPNHPALKEYVGKAYRTIGEILERKKSFSISIREGLLVYENLPLYRVSIQARRFIDLLDGRKIGGIVMRRGLALPELLSLVEILVALPDELGHEGDIEKELAHRGVKHIEVLGPQEEEEATGALLEPKVIYREAVQLMRRVVRAISTQKQLQLSEVNKLVGQITSAVLKNREALLALTSIKDYDEYTFTHSVNVCVISTALASLFLKTSEELEEVGQAALLHDIGKILVPVEIINKPAQLNDEEWAIMHKHPTDGARIHAEAGGVKPMSVIVAFEHHMGYDMRGYPKAEMIKNPNPVSLLVQIADVYDAMTSLRPYQLLNTPEYTLAEMSSGAGKAFEPRFLKEFVGMMGVFPVGTLVLLDSGEIGIVERLSEKEPSKPTVKIVRGKDGKELKKPFTVDLGVGDKRIGKGAPSIARSLESERTGIDKLTYI